MNGFQFGFPLFPQRGQTVNDKASSFLRACKNWNGYGWDSHDFDYESVFDRGHLSPLVKSSTWLPPPPATLGICSASLPPLTERLDGERHHTNTRRTWTVQRIQVQEPCTSNTWNRLGLPTTPYRAA